VLAERTGVAFSAITHPAKNAGQRALLRPAWRDDLILSFGQSNLFIDVDNLRAGQRFDDELAKALAACDVFEWCTGVNRCKPV
jgi:hypothetical protein